MRSRGGTAALVLAGVLLAQAAWILALPPFRGSDEFDHAFRAAGVASGQWRLTEPAEDGRGFLVTVPEELAEAAGAQCASLPYTLPDNCFPVSVSDGKARIGTAAAGYNPIFYWVIGTAGRPFDGAASLYAMRAAAALLCLVGFGASFVALRGWSGGATPWATMGLLTALTPTVVYTTVVAAPNGAEISAGLCLWASLIGLGRTPVDVVRERRLFALAVVATAALLILRTLGPLWVVGILVVAVLFHGPRTVREVIARHRGMVALGAVVSVLTAAWSVSWVLGSHGYAGEPGSDADDSWWRVFEVPKWTVQMIGAFPYRDQIAPEWALMLVLLVIGTVLVVALRRSSGWSRLGLTAGTVGVLVTPMVLTWITLEERGGQWQGRYILPFAVGVLPLAGLVLDRVGWAPVEGPRLRALAWVMLTAAHIGCVVDVLHAELGREVSSADPGWVQPPILAVAGLMLAAWLCWGAALRRRGDG